MKMLGKWNLGLTLLLMTAAASAQSSISTAEPFASIDNSLSGSADRLLAAAAAQRRSGTVELPAQVGVAQELRPTTTGLQASQWRELRRQIEPILKAQGLPVEVLAVVKVESGGRLDALSARGARGLWQLMPDTARRYGLIVSDSKDERLDLEKATWAATRYLHDLHEMFGDWRLTLAAYNAGEEAISRAVAHVGSREFDALSLKHAIPEETRRYVPAVLAQMKLIGGTSMEEIRNHADPDNSPPVFASAGLGE